jgi:hypothetical protein
MRGLTKDKHIQIRFSEAEINKYKEIARDNGLTMSGFARYSMAKAARMIKSNKDEVL